MDIDKPWNLIPRNISNTILNSDFQKKVEQVRMATRNPLTDLFIAQEKTLAQFMEANRIPLEDLCLKNNLLAEQLQASIHNPFHTNISDFINVPYIKTGLQKYAEIIRAIYGSSFMLNFEAALTLAKPYIVSIPSLLSEISKVPEIANAIQNIHTAMPLIYNVIDKFAFVEKEFLTTLRLFNERYDILSKLNYYISSYDYIIPAQKEAFAKTDCLKSYQKRFLLLSEIRQKEKIKLLPNDFQYADIITVNAKGSVSLVNNFARFTPDEEDLYSIQDEEEQVLYNGLQSHEPHFLKILEGARQTANSDNPDKNRQTAASLRELLKQVINELAPTDKVMDYCQSRGWDYKKGKIPITYKIKYILRKVTASNMTGFIENEINVIDKLFSIFNDSNIHTSYSDELSIDPVFLCHKVESTILLLLKCEEDTRKSIYA
jgi:hypothetical protein